MKRHLSVLAAALFMLLSMCAPAHASLAEWLDKLEALSGPGPFIQRVGVSVDIVCLEGQWWQNPATLPRIPVPVDLENRVIADLGADATNPFRIATLIKRLREPQNGGSPDTPGDSPRHSVLLSRFKTNPDQMLRILRRQLRTQAWRVREEILNADREEVVSDVFRRLGIDPREAPDSGDALEEGVTLKANPFCIGDLRQYRLNFGVSAAWLTTDTLPIDAAGNPSERYSYAPAVAVLSPRINAYPIAVTIESALPVKGHPVLIRSWDVGASVGAINFRAEGDRKRFESFWLGPYIEFPRVTLRPLAFAACHTKRRCPGNWTGWDVLELEAVWKLIPSVRPEQFGALAGIASPRHTQWWLRVGLAFKFHSDQTTAAFRD